MSNTVSQEFYSVEINFFKCVESKEFTIENINKVVEDLKESIINHGGECEINISDIDNVNESFNVYIHNNGNPFFVEKCDIDYPYPDVRYLPNGDPGYPGSDGAIYCYECTQDLLWNIYHAPGEWDYEVIDEDFENEETLWEKLSPEEPDEGEY